MCRRLFSYYFNYCYCNKDGMCHALCNLLLPFVGCMYQDHNSLFLVLNILTTLYWAYMVFLFLTYTYQTAVYVMVSRLSNTLYILIHSLWIKRKIRNIDMVWICTFCPLPEKLRMFEASKKYNGVCKYYLESEATICHATYWNAICFYIDAHPYYQT